MNKIQWFSVSNQEEKRFPEWRRSFGVSESGTVFVPAAMAGDETEMNVLLCACTDGQASAVHLDHHFVPSHWLKNEFPKHSELIEIIEARAKTAFSDQVLQEEQDVFSQAAAQMHRAFPPIVQTITQDNADSERIYPKGGDVRSGIARHPTQNVTDFLPEAHKALIDALERVLLDPKIAALPPAEQARLTAQLVIAESATRASGAPVHVAKRYIAGLTYLNGENVEADGHEAETNAPYYFGSSMVTAFEAGAIWQGQQPIESK